MRDSLTAATEGRSYELPGTADEINERELAAGIGTPLSDAAARADHLLTEIEALYEKAIDKPVQWFAAANATEAVLRNSLSHPRSHIVEYLVENGEVPAGRGLLDEGLEALESLSASDYVRAVLKRLRDDPRFEERVTT